MLAVALTLPLPAQVAAPAGAEAATRINPFEVISQTNDSFLATEVGTGGRLVLDLKDVPAQYSVINRAFIDALGITDLTEAASWAPGQSFASDIGNSGGNFDGQYGRFTQRGIQQVITPNTTGTSGSSNGVMRNFYQTNFGGNQDSYSVESFDFGQGPNGILFGGAGSMGQFQASGAAAGLAGVSSSQTKRARFDRSTTTISGELGAFQYRRFTLDHNQPLGAGFGVRVNLLDLETGGYKFHEHNMRRGLHVTTTWRINNSTDLTVEGSIDKSSVNYPTLARENISGWDGRTTARGFIDTTMIPSTVNNNTASLSRAYGSIIGTNGVPVAFSGEPNGVTRLTATGFGGTNGADVYLWDQSTQTIVNWRGRLTSRRADNTNRTPLWSKTAPNGEFFVRGTRTSTVSNGVNILAEPSFGVVDRSYLNLEGLPADMYERVLQNSKARLLGFRENLTWDGEGTVARNRDLQFSFAKSFGRHFAFGLGGDWNITKTSGATMDRGGGANTFQLDLNQLLPDGTPNPRFLEMFSQSGNDGINDQNSVTEDRAIRANVHFDHDFGKFGNYVFNINGNANTRSYDFQFLQVFIVDAPNDPVLSKLLLDPRNLNVGTVRMQMYQSYDNLNFRDGRQPQMFTLMNSNWSGTGAESNTNAHTPVAVTSQVRTEFRASMSDTGFHRALIQSFKRRDLALQTTAKWLNNKVVFLGGIRRDFNSNIMRQQMAARYYPTVDPITRPAGFAVPEGVRWDGVTKYYKPVFSGTGQEYGALTYRPRNAAGVQVGTARIASTRPTTTLPGGRDGGNLNGTFVVDDPRYATDRFRDDFSPPEIAQYGTTKTYGVTLNVLPWFAPYANKSDQILPIGPNSATTTTPNLDLYGKLQDDVLSEGTDFGARFNFFGGRVAAKWNYYNTTRYKNPSGNGVITQINNLINSNNWQDTNVSEGATTAINQLGITPLNTNGDYATTGNFGYEWELTAQVMSGLRLSVNGGKSSTFEDNRTFYPLTHQFVRDADRLAEFKALLEDAGGSLDSSRKPLNNGQAIALAPGLAIPTPLAGKGVGIDTTNAVNAYNNIWINYDNLESDQTRSRSTPSYNFFADYTVQSGPVRGLRAGMGVQWQGKRSIGNAGSWSLPYVDPVLGLRAIDDPRYTNQDQLWIPGNMRTQMNFSYTFRQAEGRSLTLGLRVNNIGSKTHRYGGVLRQPQGDLSKPDRVTLQAGNPATVLDPVNARLTVTYTFGSGSSR